MSRFLNSCHPSSADQDQQPVLCYAPARQRQNRQPPPRLKPASQSYLHRDSQAAIIGVIIGLAGILLAAKLWLIRLLG